MCLWLTINRVGCPLKKKTKQKLLSSIRSHLRKIGTTITGRLQNIREEHDRVKALCALNLNCRSHFDLHAAATEQLHDLLLRVHRRVPENIAYNHSLCAVLQQPVPDLLRQLRSQHSIKLGLFLGHLDPTPTEHVTQSAAKVPCSIVQSARQNPVNAGQHLIQVVTYLRSQSNRQQRRVGATGRGRRFRPERLPVAVHTWNVHRTSATLHVNAAGRVSGDHRWRRRWRRRSSSCSHGNAGYQWICCASRGRDRIHPSIGVNHELLRNSGRPGSWTVAPELSTPSRVVARLEPQR